jgi:hypothetical protein
MICGTDVGRLTTESFSRESFRLGRLCIEVWRQATILEALFSSFGRMPFFFSNGDATRECRMWLVAVLFRVFYFLCERWIFVFRMDILVCSEFACLKPIRDRDGIETFLFAFDSLVMSRHQVNVRSSLSMAIRSWVS